MSLAKMRVVLADGQPVMREGLRISLERAGDFHIIGEAGSGPDVARIVEGRQPDALVVEAGLPHALLTDLIPRLRVLVPGLCVLVSFLDQEAEQVPTILAAGAQACLARNSPSLEFLQALRAISQGGLYLSGSLASGLVRSTRQVPKDDLYQLTERETEVLRFIGGGFSNKEIARRLALSVRTVETHRLNIRRKTGSARLRDLVYAARQLGLDRPEGVGGEAGPSPKPLIRHLRSV